MFTLSAMLYPIAGIIGLIIFMVLIGLGHRRIQHSQADAGINHAILKPVITAARTTDVTVVHNVITNVRWPLNR